MSADFVQMVIIMLKKICKNAKVVKADSTAFIKMNILDHAHLANIKISQTKHFVFFAKMENTITNQDKQNV